MELYLPLALRYRPVKFNDVVGQAVAVKVLSGMLNNNRVGSGYLFGGLRGTGKTSLARVFAKALNCKSKDGIEPCCKCRICTDIAKGKSSDVLEVDSASAGSVAAIRGMKETSFLATLGKGYRVFILDEAHDLQVLSLMILRLSY